MQSEGAVDWGKNEDPSESLTPSADQESMAKWAVSKGRRRGSQTEATSCCHSHLLCLARTEAQQCTGFFGVFDGHGGPRCSDLIAQWIPEVRATLCKARPPASR